MKLSDVTSQLATDSLLASLLVRFLRGQAVDAVTIDHRFTHQYRNEILNYLEQLALDIERGEFPCAGCKDRRMYPAPKYDLHEQKAATEEED